MTALKTRSEQRLDELEALQRPLSEEESVELRKCLHAIYMRQWRIETAEREMNALALAEHNICPESLAKIEIDGIARRMEASFDPDWPLPVSSESRWQEDARHSSDMLRDAILNAAARALAA